VIKRIVITGIFDLLQAMVVSKFCISSNGRFLTSCLLRKNILVILNKILAMVSRNIFIRQTQNLDRNRRTYYCEAEAVSEVSNFSLSVALFSQEITCPHYGFPGCFFFFGHGGIFHSFWKKHDYPMVIVNAGIGLLIDMWWA
jgi:hypothetical protein